MITICDDLRKSILQAAIQGKLTKQLPEDGNVEDLYKQIQTEKQRLINEGKIKKEKPLPEIKEDEIPFDIPENWKWVHIQDIGTLMRGSGIQKNDTTSIGYGCVRYGEIYTSYHLAFSQTRTFTSEQVFIRSKHIKNGDLIFTLTGENKPDIAKTIAYFGSEKIAVGGDLAIWSNHNCDSKYLSYFMYSPFAIEQKVKVATGDIIVHISCDKVGKLLLPLPPLAEQRRIVAKVDELLVKVGEMEMTEKAITTLYEEFSGDMKASLLQAAIQGKLTEQLPEDGNAEDLYKEIQAEKQRLIKEGKIKKDKNESYIFRRDNSHYEKLGDSERCIDDEIPFEIPMNWKWVNLSNVIYHVGNKSNQILTKDVKEYGKYPVVSQGQNLIDGYCDNEECLVSIFPVILFGDHTKNVKYINFPFVIGSDGVKLIKPIFIEPHYLFYWTLFTASQIENRGYARHYTLLVQKKLPLPPLAEQKRIVDILDMLLSICNDLNS